MNRLAVAKGAGLLAAIGFGIGLVHAAYTLGSNLYISGGLASSRVIQHDGIAYVPVADVAKALNQTVATKADGYAIVPSGGANQVGGVNGKIGDKLTNGEIQFTVVKAFRTPKYVYQFGDGDKEPNGPSDDVVVVVVRMKNMRGKSTEISPSGGDNSSLTDQDEHGYPSRYADCHGHLPYILPGAACDFALTFSVPKAEKIGDLIYQLYYIDNGGKPVTFRVSLASINP